MLLLLLQNLERPLREVSVICFSVAVFGLLLVTFQVFKKFGVGKYDPTNEEFDPNKHNAVFQVPDPKKAPGMVAVCLKVSVGNFFSGILVFYLLFQSLCTWSLWNTANPECTSDVTFHRS